MVTIIIRHFAVVIYSYAVADPWFPIEKAWTLFSIFPKDITKVDSNPLWGIIAQLQPEIHKCSTQRFLVNLMIFIFLRSSA